MHQPSSPWVSHDALLSGVLKINTLVPAGAMGIQLQSKLPLMWVHADSLGWRRDFCSKFNVILACGSNLSH